MDVGGKIVEPHDLRHACRRDLAEMSEFGLVDDGSTLNQSVAMVGKGKQSADSGNATSRCNWPGTALHLFGSTALGGDVELAVDG